MNREHMYYFLTLILCNLFLHEQKSYADEVPAVTEKKETSLKTFHDPIAITCGNTTTGALTCGAQHNNVGSSALMRSFSTGMPFISITPEKVTLNGIEDSLNPLYDKSVMHLSSIITPPTLTQYDTQRMLVVTHANPGSLVMIDTTNNQDGHMVRSIDPINDACGEKTSGILALEGCSGGSNGAFAVVKPCKGTFPEKGSGIAVVSFGSEEVEVEKDKIKTKKTEWHFSQVDLGNNKDASAFPLDLNTKAAAITHQLTSMSDKVALHWNGEFGRIFIGLNLVAGQEKEDGACALLVGKIVTAIYTADDEKKTPYTRRYLELEPFIPHQTVVDSSSAIVAARGAKAHVAVHSITTFKTTTGMHYTALVGGCGTDAETRKTVYALPLHVGNDGLGTLAPQNQAPITLFTEQTEPLFRSRYLDRKATSVETVSQSHHAAACVGNGPLDAGPIEKLIPAKDAIFAIVKGSNATHAGIYHSQALLDVHGCIKAWTNWQRVHQPLEDKCMLTAFYNQVGGFFTFVTGDNEHEINEIVYTGWGIGNKTGLKPLVSFLRETYTKNNGGVRSCADVPVGMINHYQSFMLVAGHKMLTIALMSERDEQGTIRYTKGDQFKDVITLHDKTVDYQSNAKIVHYKEGSLAQLGTIEAITAAATPDATWLFAGGTGGLAVYTDQHGNGFDPEKNLIFDTAYCNKQFVPVGSYAFVKRLFYDDGYLYVLTDVQLDRIDLTASTFGPKGIQKTITLATCSMLNNTSANTGVFTDIIVSDKLAILATSFGVYRIGNNCAIQHAQTPEDVHWQKIDIGNEDPVVHLSTFSITGNPADVARYGGGNLHVIQGYTGKNRATIKRFTVEDISRNAIDNDTVAFIPDVQIEHAPTMFRRIGSFTPCCATDGALWLYIRKALNKDISSLYAMNDFSPKHDTQVRIYHTEPANFLRAQRFSASGNKWWALGETVIVHE